MSKLGYPCGGCGGEGKQEVIDPKGGPSTMVDCPPCKGSGKIEVEEGATSRMAERVGLPLDYDLPKGK